MKHLKDQRIGFHSLFLKFSLLFASCLILILPNLHAASYVAVGTTLNRMLHSPDQFCDYIDIHQTTFNINFENCVNYNIEWREDKTDEIWDYCTDVHGEGTDARTACFEVDYDGLALENQVVMLQGMVSITNYGGDCMLADAQYGWMADEWDPEAYQGLTWEEFWDQQLSTMESGYACQTSNDDEDDEEWWEQICFISTVFPF